MRCGLILAAGLMAIPLAALSSADSAHAQQYCGFNPHPGSIVECGYSSREGCENAIGKGAMCFVSPYIALDTRRAAPSAISGPHPARG